VLAKRGAFRRRSVRGQGLSRADREGNRRDWPADRRHSSRDTRVSKCDQGNQPHYRKIVGNLINHCGSGRGAGRCDTGDFPQRATGRAGDNAGQFQHHRRATWSQRNRVGLIAGTLGGEVAVQRQQPPQARSRQVPQHGACSLTTKARLLTEAGLRQW
jgi:hypothetical protein